MYQKLSRICNKILSLKVIFICFILNVCVLCAIFTSNNEWSTLYDYPEDVYQSLEKEAYNIIQKKDFSSDYKLVITHYDNQSNRLTIELSCDSLTLTVTVYNYGKDTQQITIKRDYPTASQRFFITVLLLLLFCLIFAFLETGALTLVIGLLWIIVFVINKVKNK